MRPNLVTTLPVTFGSNKKNAAINMAQSWCNIQIAIKKAKLKECGL